MSEEVGGVPPGQPSAVPQPQPAEDPSGGGPPTGSPQPEMSRPRGRPAQIISVTDGDTVVARFLGTSIDVRLIGIDTPETMAPGEPVQCFGPQASAFTTSRLEGSAVRLEFDVEREDQYGRTLAYVWVEDRLFNATLVRRGYATVTTFPPNVRYVDRFLAAQRRARQRHIGLWGVCEQPEGSAATEAGVSGGMGCDPSYPDVCIAPYPPDLDCADIPHVGFRTVGADQHRFDSDGDGIGCEP